MKWIRKRMTFSSFIMCTIFVYTLFASVHGQTLKMAQRSEFQAGDAIRITIVEIEQQSVRGAPNFNLNNDYSIARDGTIFMPLIGKIKVIGHDKESLTGLIAEKYSPYFNEPFITVTPLIRIVLMGAFNKPGSYRIDPEASLWELIDLADGPDPNCDLNSIQVTRGGDVVIKNLLLSFEQGHSLKEIGVRSGDQINAKWKRNFGLDDFLNYFQFGVTLVLLYMQIQRYTEE